MIGVTLNDYSNWQFYETQTQEETLLYEKRLGKAKLLKFQQLLGITEGLRMHNKSDFIWLEC